MAGLTWEQAAALGWELTTARDGLGAVWHCGEKGAVRCRATDEAALLAAIGEHEGQPSPGYGIGDAQPLERAANAETLRRRAAAARSRLLVLAAKVADGTATAAERAELLVLSARATAALIRLVLAELDAVD